MFKVGVVAVMLVLSVLPALAAGQGHENDGGGVRGAPAPIIGAGLPVLAAAGAFFLGRKLIRRIRK